MLLFRKDAEAVVSSPNPAWEGERGPGLICNLLRSTSGPEKKISLVEAKKGVGTSMEGWDDPRR